MTRLKARLLIAVYQFQQDSRQLTHLATALGVAKSTVSRAVQDLQEEGLLLYSEREIRLTAYGRKQTEELSAEYERLYMLLSGSGVPAQQAANDSYTLMLELSEHTRAALLSSRTTAAQATSYDVEQGAFLLPDGIYPLPFAFYKAGEKGPRTLSMANSAFVHPAQLIVKSGKGSIRLKMSPVSRTSPFHDQVVHDVSLKRMSYQDGGHRRDCLIEGDTVCFPIEALCISLIPDINVTVGEALVHLAPGVDAKHMPERTAVFTVFLEFQP